MEKERTTEFFDARLLRLNLACEVQISIMIGFFLYLK